jgi:hypothetical protein
MIILVFIWGESQAVVCLWFFAIFEFGFIFLGILLRPFETFWQNLFRVFSDLS